MTRNTRLTSTGGRGEWADESRDPLQRSVRTEWSGTTPAATTLPFSRVITLTVDGMGRTPGVNVPDTAMAGGTSPDVA